MYNGWHNVILDTISNLVECQTKKYWRKTLYKDISQNPSQKLLNYYETTNDRTLNDNNDGDDRYTLKNDWQKSPKWWFNYWHQNVLSLPLCHHSCTIFCASKKSNFCSGLFLCDKWPHFYLLLLCSMPWKLFVQ